MEFVISMTRDEAAWVIEALEEKLKRSPTLVCLDEIKDDIAQQLDNGDEADD